MEVDWNRRFDHMQQHSGNTNILVVCINPVSATLYQDTIGTEESVHITEVPVFRIACKSCSWGKKWRPFRVSLERSSTVDSAVNNAAV